MGYEVAGGLGAKMAEPERDVFVFVGDGSYIMLHSELLTSIQEDKKITIILFDNLGFQCIYNLQTDQGSEGFGTEFRYRSKEDNQLSGKYIEIDFASNARSYGAMAYTARTTEEFKDALKKARENKVTTLIDTKVLPGTMSGSYESWWYLGVAEVSESKKVQEAYKEMKENLDKSRKY